tara:strand:+ start:1307 stop:1894 length:588 start_codon:yes stop_codon:yes gene_type:complete
MAKRQNAHYVNNADFSLAVVDYVKKAGEAKSKKEEVPKVTDYIATCFLKIAEGLSHKANFIRYTYREEMVMDAVENCLKAISNYNLEAATRTGKPNAFAYFTQITWFAFLRRIAKEKKQQEIKLKYLTQSGIENFISENENADVTASQVTNSFVDVLKNRIDKIKVKDEKIKTLTKQIKKRRRVVVDSDLEEFML